MSTTVRSSSWGTTALVNKRAAVGAGGVGDNVWSWDTVNPKAAIYTRVFTFAAGAADGALTELGASAATNGQVNTRALFKDGFGDPTVVNVAADEQLVVTYRLYIVPNETDAVLIKVQNGTEYTLTFRLANLGNTFSYATGSDILSGVLWASQGTSYSVTPFYGGSSAIGAITGSPVGTAGVAQDMPAVLGSYVNGNYYRDDSITAQLSHFNYSNLGALYGVYGTPFRWQIGISPRINKTSNDTLKFVIRTRWYRA